MQKLPDGLKSADITEWLLANDYEPLDVLLALYQAAAKGEGVMS